MSNPFELIENRLSTIEELLLDFKQPSIISTQVPVEKEEFLTIPEVCAMLKVSRGTLHKHRKVGLVNAHNFGAQVRYKKSDVLAALNLTKINRR